MPHSPATVQKMLVNLPETLSNGQGFSHAHTHTRRSRSRPVVSFSHIYVSCISFIAHGPLHLLFDFEIENNGTIVDEPVEPVRGITVFRN